MISSKLQVASCKFPVTRPEKISVPQFPVATNLASRWQKPSTFNLELGTLLACAACYGKSDSPLASGMNAGIFTLLGVILTVLTCFGLFFVHVMRGNGKPPDTDSTPPTPNPTPKNPADV